MAGAGGLVPRGRVFNSISFVKAIKRGGPAAERCTMSIRLARAFSYHGILSDTTTVPLLPELTYAVGYLLSLRRHAIFSGPGRRRDKRSKGYSKKRILYERGIWPDDRNSVTNARYRPKITRKNSYVSRKRSFGRLPTISSVIGRRHLYPPGGESSRKNVPRNDYR